MERVAETEAVGTLSFHQALIQAEAQARSTLDVALHERLACAVALVKTGRTFQASDGTWQVESTSQAGVVYNVNGVCNCEDHHYNHPPQGLCKHRLAMFLSQRVLTLMRQPAAPVLPVLPALPVEPWPDNDVEPEPEAPPSPAVPPAAPLPEAPCSVNVRLLIDGRDCQLTLRDTDEARLLQRLAAVLAQHPAPASPQGPPQSAAPQCPQHGALRQGKRGWFCAQKLDDDTWCKSKGR